MATRKVRDIMATEVITLGRNDTLQLARDIMTLGRIRHFPIVEEGEVVGVISQRDLFHASLGSVMKYGEKAEREFLGTVAVKEEMKDPPITVSPDASIKEAARMMVEKQIGCLPVVEEGELVGLVTETDILKEVAGM
jgi:CBS domain-containing protein